jgi:hypothetical protein
MQCTTHKAEAQMPTRSGHALVLAGVGFKTTSGCKHIFTIISRVDSQHHLDRFCLDDDLRCLPAGFPEMMDAMERQPETAGSTIPWGKVVGILVIILACVYASQHPHSLFGYFVKALFAP